ncbi:hypothetical protein [Deinococcus hohokamensis]|uniref:Uncharacterized protein n=1 Tax=Deinococcus hohokamensis TaxID=309883 RepID=A0ABV9IA70_9DEIO
MTPEQWLSLATHGLVPEAQRRVRAEYLAHLEDALEAGEEQAEVVSGWGDPVQAGRDLRRAHLTIQDAEHLTPGYAPSWKGFWRAQAEDALVVAVPVIFLLRDFLTGSAKPEDVGLSLSMVATLLMVGGLRWWLLSRVPLRPVPRAGLDWLLRPMSVFMVLLVVVLGWKLSQNLTAVVPLLRSELAASPELAFILAVLAFHVSRLRRALRAAQKVQAIQAGEQP